MRRSLAFLLVGLLALAGCAGGDDDEAAGDTTPTTTTSTTRATTTSAGVLSKGEPNPVMGETLLRFVKAAGRNDAGAMWAELSIPTRASIGPTLSDFAGGNAGEFNQGLGTLAPSARVVLSRRLDDQFGVAAIVGKRTVNGKEEEFAYGVALVSEGQNWRLELGGIVITGLNPEPLERTGATPEIRSNVGAAGQLSHLDMWLDDKPLVVHKDSATPFTAKLSATSDRPLAAGRHVAVTFAATSDTATATAWPFTVE